MAPTVNPPSQTTGTPEIAPSPRFSPSSILQGTQTHKNQLKPLLYTFLLFEYVASASVERYCLFPLCVETASPEFITMTTTVTVTVTPTPTNCPNLGT